jgi:RPA family protein
MKLRYIFSALAAAALAFVGCQEEERFLDELQVSQSIIALPIEGGQAVIDVTAVDNWEITDIPEWVTVSPATGAAGTTQVVFSAAEGKETREAILYINVRDVQQVLNVMQMAEKVELPFTDCQTVLKENIAGKNYKCKGTITDLTNYDKYGCFYINDGTATVYVYGSMNPTQFKPEVGDIISFEGPWTSYGNFDDVTILSLEKSLIKLEKVLPSTPLPLEGGVATALLTVKEGDVTVEIPEADQAWLSAGEPAAIGGMTSIELTAAPNEGGARTSTVTFKVNVGGKDYIAMADIEQLGAIAAVSVADFLAAAEGTSLYKLTGVVKNIANTTYGNFDLVDATGSVYVYGLTNAGAVGANDKSFASLGINEGDVVTIIGTRASYKGTAQVGGTAYLVSHDVAATQITVADFLAKSKDSSVRYKLTGKITNLKTGNYGNFHLQDETGSVYVYGLTTSLVAKNDQSFPKLGLKEGDIVTIVGTRDRYDNAKVENEKDQVGGPAYYVSHEAGAGDGGNDDGGNDDGGDDTVEVPFTSNVAFAGVSSAYTDGLATVNGVADIPTLKFGTSKLYGEGTITLPAGTKTVKYYAVGWKGNSTTLEFSVNGSVVTTQAVVANDGASGNAPYTMTVTASDCYTFSLPSALTAETTVTVKTTGSYRAIMFGINAYTK